MGERRSPGEVPADVTLDLAHVMGSGGEAIDAVERMGQNAMVHATTLPSDNRSRKEMEALGFTFGELVPSDAMFQDATLPEGWTREGSEHAQYSYIVDERGIRRVTVYYKAASYDRCAFVSVTSIGGQVVTQAAYGVEDSPVLPEWFGKLTDEERAEVIVSLEREREHHQPDGRPTTDARLARVELAIEQAGKT